MRKGLKKAVVFGVSTGLVLASLSGCSKKEEKVFDTAAAAVTVGDASLSVGVVNFAVRYYQTYWESAYQSFGIEDPYNSDLYGNGSTFGEQSKSTMVSELTEALLAEQHMDDYGVSVTDEEKSQISEVAAQFIGANDEEVLKTVGIDQDSVERYLELTLIQTKMEEAMSADVDTEVSDEEAAQRRVQYVIFTPDYDEDEEEALTEADTESAAEDETEIAAEAETELAAEADAETELPAETEEETAEPAQEETAQLTENDQTKTSSADETEALTEEETEAAEPEDETEALTEAEADTEDETEVLTEAEEETEAETEDPETIAARERAYENAMEMIQEIQAGTDFEEAAEARDKTPSEITFGADYSLEELVTATDGLEDGELVEEPVLTSTGSYYVVQVISAFDEEATEEEKESIVEERKDEAVHALYDEWLEDVEVTTDDEVLATITFDYFLAAPEEEETESLEADETELPEAESEEAPEAETEALTEAQSAAEETESENETVTSEAETEVETTDAETEAETE